MKTKLKKELKEFLKDVRVDEIEMGGKCGEFGWTDATGIMRPSDSGYFVLTIRGYAKQSKRT